MRDASERDPAEVVKALRAAYLSGFDAGWDGALGAVLRARPSKQTGEQAFAHWLLANRESGAQLLERRARRRDRSSS